MQPRLATGVAPCWCSTTPKPGRKILISGGGRCNFTNHQAGPHAFLSANPHFCKSALARYTQQDFIDLVDRHGLNYHEKTLGQLFCDDSAKDIVDILLTECDWAGVTLQFQTEIPSPSAKTDEGFVLDTSKGRSPARRWWSPPAASPCRNSVPPLRLQAGGAVRPHRAADSRRAGALYPASGRQGGLRRSGGVSLPVAVTAEDGTRFKEAMLFTHRGLSGPAILQISSFGWRGRRSTSTCCRIRHSRDPRGPGPQAHPAQELKTVLGRRAAQAFRRQAGGAGMAGEQADAPVQRTGAGGGGHPAGDWQILPNGTEGYRTAEVTLGVDTNGSPPRPWRRAPCPASTSSAKWWT